MKSSTCNPSVTNLRHLILLSLHGFYSWQRYDFILCFVETWKQNMLKSECILRSWIARAGKQSAAIFHSVADTYCKYDGNRSNHTRNKRDNNSFVQLYPSRHLATSCYFWTWIRIKQNAYHIFSLSHASCLACFNNKGFCGNIVLPLAILKNLVI